MTSDLLPQVSPADKDLCIVLTAIIRHLCHIDGSIVQIAERHDLFSFLISKMHEEAQNDDFMLEALMFFRSSTYRNHSTACCIGFGTFTEK